MYALVVICFSVDCNSALLDKIPVEVSRKYSTNSETVKLIFLRVYVMCNVWCTCACVCVCVRARSHVCVHMHMCVYVRTCVLMVVCELQ